MNQPQQTFQYYLLPSANPPLHLTERHNQIYRFWKHTWQGVLAELHVEVSNLADEFIRQDFIAAICTETDVVAVHLYSFFNLGAEASLQHHYLAGNYPPEFFTKLNAFGTRMVMSMEYLTVNPDFRKTKGGIAWGAVIGGLGLEVLCQNGVDAMIAPARRDHKVNEMAYAQGGDCIIENVMNHNVLCDLVAIRRERICPCPSQQIEQTKHELWASRIQANPINILEAPPARALRLVA